MTNCRLGIIGLGRIGGGLALQALEKGLTVAGLDKVKVPDLESRGVPVFADYPSFVAALARPRLIYLSLPAGPTVDEVLKRLVPFLEKGDVVLDGGNSFFLDSVRREKDLAGRGIDFLDCGTSGGVAGARRGACFMVGGRPEGVRRAEPILKALAVEGGYIHTGPPGSGHYVKLVHNGVEFGMLQAIGEGLALLESGDFDLDPEKIVRTWSHGSVIRGWLLELLASGLAERESQAGDDYLEDTGEVNWLVQHAVAKEIPIPVISQSVMELFKSRLAKSEAYRAIALMRHGFGGHPFGPDESIARERKTSRVEKI
jgi:6-phosphogluconate dehydrogenase